MSNTTRYYYILSIDVDSDLPRQVVDNYIPRALKRYTESDKDPQKAFGNRPPHLLLMNLPDIDFSDTENAPKHFERIMQRAVKHFYVLKRLGVEGK